MVSFLENRSFRMEEGKRVLIFNIGTVGKCQTFPNELIANVLNISYL